MIPLLFSVTGKVVKGNQLGSQLGYPTANIEVSNKSSFYSLAGVYAVRVNLDTQSYWGMANIGTRPTIADPSFTIEVHLFDFNHSIYGKIITIQFISRVRDELALPGLQALIDQMKRDEIDIRALCASLDNPDTHTQ